MEVSTYEEQFSNWSKIKAHIINHVKSAPPGLPVVLCIGGAGCMGKSSLAEELVSYFPDDEGVLFDMDGYLKDKEIRDKEPAITGYNPGSYNIELMKKHFRSMFFQKKTVILDYNHLKRESRKITISNCPKIKLIAVDGVHANTDYFKYGRFALTKVDFAPRNQSVLHQSRTEVEHNQRDRKKKNDSEHYQRLDYHDQEYYEFIDPHHEKADIKITVDRVNKLSRPTLASFCYQESVPKFEKKQINSYRELLKEIIIDEKYKINIESLLADFKTYKKMKKRNHMLFSLQEVNLMTNILCNIFNAVSDLKEWLHPIIPKLV